MASAVAAAGQQIPFISLTGPHAPQGASVLLEDSLRGGLWLGSATEAGEGLTYFDGSRFISPLKEPFPRTEISGMAEDDEGGIWLATYDGVFRAFRGHLQRVVYGAAQDGMVQAGPELFLATVTAKGALHAQLLRIGRAKEGNWNVDVILPSTSRIHFEPDGAGHILFACPGGYCEFGATDAAQWHTEKTFPTMRHQVRQFGEFQESLILKDRFGCVWQRGKDSSYEGGRLAYQCPEDLQSDTPTDQPQPAADLVGQGGLALSETEDGSIVIPSFSKLAVGRPGRFHVYTAAQGFPGTINAVTTKHGIWMSSGNGLFVMPRRDRIEFWTERDGLEGNTWSILRTASNTFAVAGQSLRILHPDRTRWDLLPSMPNVWHLSVGLNGGITASTATGQALGLSSQGKVMGQLHSVDRDLTAAANESDPRGDLRACLEASKIFGNRSILALLSEVCVSFVRHGHRDIWRSYVGGGFLLAEDVAGAHPQVWEFASGGDVGTAVLRFLGVDQRGWIWRGSPVGIYVADPEQARQGRWLLLNSADGIAGKDANTGSFFSDPDGSVWFGADDAINHIYPSADLVQTRETPALFISSFSLDDGEAQMAEMVGNVQSQRAHRFARLLSSQRTPVSISRTA